MSNKGRIPDQKELSLWAAIKKTITPMERKDGDSNAELSFRKDTDKGFSRKTSGETPRLMAEQKPAFSPPPSPSTRHLDARTESRLRKGKMPIEAILDMHGMNQVQAHQALNRFVTRAFQEQKRCVLVITGKGGRAGEPEGILKQRLPMWLEMDPLNERVIKSVTAHRKHGGSGAFYLYLRRQKPN